MLYEAGRRHFYENPRVGENGEVIPTKEMYFFTTISRLRLYMILAYKLPLQVCSLAYYFIHSVWKYLSPDVR
jgi:alcohol-forming fatty acyl-CoA reductase